MSSTVPLPPERVLVATKLHVPQLRPGTIARPELVDRLVGDTDRKLTLVCAPAGWGKTFLLIQWHASDAETRPFAWVSLDPGDDDPVRFWSYVVGAIQTVAAEVGNSALAMLPNAGPALTDIVLPGLINELASVQRPLVLVLDDYHVVHDELIHESVAFLLRHLPRTVHLAIASRADPPLALGRMRAAAEVMELRAAELRFSDGEADLFLNGTLDLALAPDDVGLLQERTEGWPAGLQLAALSLRDRDDRSAFVHAFAGDDRQIGEYLHEVIEGLDRPLREFLLRTSILERLCAPLCVEVTDDGDAAASLARAYRSNVFLVGLDARGYWFRYHHLFRDLLRHELAAGEPELVPELHRRAFAWHRTNGDAEEAIFHAAAAGENAAARELIAEHWLPAWHISRKTVTRWLEALPAADVLADPRLCVMQGYTAMLPGHVAEAERWLEAAEAGPDSGPLLGASVEANVALVRSGLAWVSGDVGRAADAARRADALIDDETSPAQRLADMFLGLTRYFTGDLVGATEPLERTRGREWVGAVTLLTTLGVLAAARADLGEPVAAEAVVGEAAQLMDKFGLGESPVASISYVARGKLLELRSDSAGADAAFTRAAEVARGTGRSLELAYALIEQAGLKRRRKDIAAARVLAREAHNVLASCADPAVLSEQLAKIEHSVQLAPARRAAPELQSDPELSQRELTILRLLAGDLSQREIGLELYISLNTVKGHTRSVFRKLGVATRADAVARGRELELL